MAEWYPVSGPISPGLQNLNATKVANFWATRLLMNQNIDQILEYNNDLAQTPYTLDREAGRANQRTYPRPYDAYFSDRYRKEYDLPKPGRDLKIYDAFTPFQALVDMLNDYQPDCIITSGHASERNWQLGFTYPNGHFLCKDGQLFGSDTLTKRYDVKSDNPKVYLAVGNCLMGHVKDRDSMALAWMNSAGVRQMIGYTVNTWFGYAGWGCLDYFIEQPGRHTLTEAFLANHHALIHLLAKQPSRGLTYDRDVLAFYGDPKWEARMADRPKAWDQSLVEKDGTYTFQIKPNRGAATFEPIDTNGSLRGGRPIVAFFPKRLKNVAVVSGADLNPVITDDFILIPNPLTCDPKREYQVVFKALQQ